MRGAIKRKADAAIAILLALVFALSLSGVPVSAMADNNATNGSESNARPVSVSGIDFMQPGMTDLEVLKIDNLGNRTIYISVEKDEPGKTKVPLSKPQPYSAASNADNASAQVADILTIQLPSNAISNDPQKMVGLYADPDNKTRYSIEASTEAKQSDPNYASLYSGTIYPVYAKTISEDNGTTSTNLNLIGIRTTNDPHAKKNLHVATTYYTQEEGEDYPTTYSLQYKDGFDNEFSDKLDAFVVTYNEVDNEKNGTISGRVNYVTADSECVFFDSFEGIGEDGMEVPIRDSFIGNDEKYYRVASSLSAGWRVLTHSAPTFVVNVIPVEGMDQEAYKVKINYVDGFTKDENGNDKVLWSDKLVVNGYGYRYTLPNSFSMSYSNPINQDLNVDGVESFGLYEIVGGEKKRTSGAASISTASESTAGENATGNATENNAPDNNGESTDPKVFAGIGTALILTSDMVEDDFDGVDSDGYRIVTAKYLPSSVSKMATFTLQEIDGETNTVLRTQTKVITPEDSFEFEPVAKQIEGKNYVPWAGNTNKITYTWDDLKQGRDLLQRVYYVPEGYTPGDAYDVTIQYMNIADGQVLRTETLAIDPEMNEYAEYVGEPRFEQNGNTYVRLAGQDSGIRHAPLSKDRTYTIYYRDINDTINANTIVTRTQIVETTRTVVVPGGITAAPTAVDAEAGEPGVEAGIGAGDGTVIINDDDNPLANLNGEDTASERIIAENENPLAKASSGTLALGIAVAVAAAVLIGFLIFFRNRRRKFNNDIQNL